MVEPYPLPELVKLAFRFGAGVLLIGIFIYLLVTSMLLTEEHTARLLRSHQLQQEVIKKVQGQSEEVKSTIVKLNTTIAAQRETVERQTMSVSEINVTTKELLSISEGAASYAQAVLRDAQESVKVSDEGLLINERSAAGMDRIHRQLESIAQSILAFADQSRQIAEFVSLLDDIVQQSKVLAINASIEAAKAGDQGRGFAVVAREVRKLAVQSQTATGQIRTLVAEVDDSITSTSQVMRTGAERVSESLGKIQLLGDAIRELAEVVQKSARTASEIRRLRRSNRPAFSRSPVRSPRSSGPWTRAAKPPRTCEPPPRPSR